MGFKLFCVILPERTKLLCAGFAREGMVEKDSRCFSDNDITQLPFQEIQFEVTAFMPSMQLAFCFVLCISPASSVPE